MALLLIATIALKLLGVPWTSPFLFAELLGLILIWFYGFLKLDGLFSKSGFIERVFSIPLLLGLILNVSEISFSGFPLVIGLLILSVYILIQGIGSVRKKNFFSGIELILVGLTLFAYFARLKHFPGSSDLFVICSSLLGIVYLAISIQFIFAASNSGIVALGIMGMVSYWSISLFVNVVLFATFFWPGKHLIFYTSLGSSLITLLLLFILAKRNAELPELIQGLIRSLYKRSIILLGFGVFFGVASPQQLLRLDFGNREHLIQAYCDCRVNHQINELVKSNACIEFELLYDMLLFGIYPEGVSEVELGYLKESMMQK